MKRISIALLILILLSVPSTVLADMAPPAKPPGSNLQPGSETTQVRMVAETVLVDVQSDTTPDSLGRARVTADFTMRNLGTESESMAARFPISVDDGFGNYLEIEDLIIKVDGEQVPYQRTKYPADYPRNGQDGWAEFNITFPVGQDVSVRVVYNLNGSGYMPYTSFYYILETGAGWKDTIGSADIILRLPYPVSPQNVIVYMQVGRGGTTPGGVIQDSEMRWHFDNFEPGPNGPLRNMQFSLVAPVTWQNIIKARDHAAQHPNDSEAWGQLAKAYKEIFFMGKGYRDDTGGEALYQSSMAAYEKCLEINPKDAQWHAGFADLLADRSHWDSWDTNPDVFRALDEIHTALVLAPNDAKVLEIARNISYMFPDGMSQNRSGYDFPWLTQTPTPIPPTPTIVPVYDPAVVSGTYQSNTFTLTNNQKAQLTLTLRADHSAEMESIYDNDPPIISTGLWTDNGYGTLSIVVTDPGQKATEIKFSVGDELLHAYEYPAFYGEANIEMKRLVSATPVPTSTATSAPAPAETAPAPASKPSLPFCGSAALIGVVWLARKRGPQVK